MLRCFLRAIPYFPIPYSPDPHQHPSHLDRSAAGAQWRDLLFPLPTRRPTTQAYSSEQEKEYARTPNLFACAAIGLLTFGLLASKLWRQTGFAIYTGAHSPAYGFSNQMPLYCMAALFAGFAFLYSIGFIPFSPTLMKWHFWLSLLSLVVCVTDWAIFSWYVDRMTHTNEGVGGMLIAAALVASLLTFVSMQLWFAIDLARALFKMRAA